MARAAARAAAEEAAAAKAAAEKAAAEEAAAAKAAAEKAAAEKAAAEKAAAEEAEKVGEPEARTEKEKFDAVNIKIKHVEEIVKNINPKDSAAASWRPIHLYLSALKARKKKLEKEIGPPASGGGKKRKTSLKKIKRKPRRKTIKRKPKRKTIKKKRPIHKSIRKRFTKKR